MPDEVALPLVSSLGEGGLIVIVAVLGLLAIGSLAGIISARRRAREATRMARASTHQMNELLRTVRMAESICDLGFWQYEPATGKQHWSAGMRRMFGVGEDEKMVSGDAETLLFANDIDLVGSAMGRGKEQSPFTMRFEFQAIDGAARSLLVQACHQRGRDGEIVRVIAVLRDVTEEIRRERALDMRRLEAEREADKARELAETDALTGLANRRCVMRELDRLILAMRSAGQPLTMMTFDIDHFKRVNDTFGHIVGDQVLQRVAQIALHEIRSGDVLGRLGGEEFVWILPGIDRRQAEHLAERLRQAIAQGSALGTTPSVTVSVGLAALGPGDSSLGLFSRADRALYDAKEGGRNQVALAAAA